MPDSENSKKVTNNNLQNAQFGGGLINAETVNAERLGGDIYNRSNIHITNYYYREDIQVAAVKPTEDYSSDEKLPCPYRGLYHFSPDDAEFFFGREVFIEELFEATKTRNFIPVLGASGSGKSSVVLAGLVPKLQQQGHWLFTHFRPGSEPFYALAQALVPLYEPEINATEQMYQARQLAEYLINGSVPLKDVFQRIERNYANHRVLLIADQFEELYTLCSDDKTRRSFLDSLVEIIPSPVNQFSSSTFLIATMRVDFLGNAFSYRPFADVLQNTDIKLVVMNREELSHVIAKPAQKLRVSFEAGLVKRILDAVEDQPGNLPLLEFALTELWKRRTGKQLTHAAYEAIGEVQGALAKYAEQKYEELSLTEQEQVKQIFIQLVYPGEKTKDTRKLATKAELGEEKWSSVKQLADARLVVTSQNTVGEETVELVHEALIKEWKRLRGWIESDRIFRTWQEGLRFTMHEWENNDRNEGALLQGIPLTNAEDWLQKREADLAEKEKEYIKKSLEERDRLHHEEEERTQRELDLIRENLEQEQKAKKVAQIITGVTVFFAFAVMGIGYFTWKQYREAQFNKILALAVDGFPQPELLPAARDLLHKADQLRGSAKDENEIQEALTDYRAVINLTSLLKEKRITLVDPNLVDRIAQNAETGLVRLIEDKRLPQLESELKHGKIGKRIADTALTDFEKQFTPGALLTTYAILRRQFGAKADFYDKGEIETEKEAKRMPCKTLRQIEELWRKYTQNRCGWYNKINNDPYDDLDCKELEGKTLSRKVFEFPSGQSIERLNSCKIAPFKLDY